MCPYKKDVKEDQTHIQRRKQYEDRAERDLKMLALEIRMMQPQAKECPQSPESGKGEGWIFQKSLQKSRACLHLDFNLVKLIYTSGIWNYKGISVSSFQPLTLGDLL